MVDQRYTKLDDQTFEWERSIQTKKKIQLPFMLCEMLNLKQEDKVQIEYKSDSTFFKIYFKKRELT